MVGVDTAHETRSTTRAQALRGTLRLVAVLVLLLTAGCELTQSVATWYVTRKLDHYVDFTSAQKDAAHVRVDETIRVLRRTEVPAWVSLLRVTRQDVHVGLTADSVARLQRAYDARVDAAVAIVVPELARMLVGITPAQIDHLSRKLREDVDEQFEDLSLPAERQRAKLEERAIDALEDLVGDLSDAQERSVRAIVSGLPDDRPAQQRVALVRLAGFRSFLLTRPSAESLDVELRSMWEHRDDGLGAGRDRATREAEQRLAILSIDRLLDPAQRAHAEEELTKRIRKLQRFMLAD